MKFLHFTNNDDFDESTHAAPKLKKIWEVYQALLENFQKVYTPSRDVSVDESLMAYKGRLSWVQFIATKHARFGIKIFMLCESQTGYIWNSVLYTGSLTRNTATMACLLRQFWVWLRNLLGKGYCITMDNFYTSPELLDILIKNKTDMYGTVRSNRKKLPNNFAKEKLNKATLKPDRRARWWLFGGKTKKMSVWWVQSMMRCWKESP